jgi:hypothetical protein
MIAVDTNGSHLTSRLTDARELSGTATAGSAILFDRRTGGIALRAQPYRTSRLGVVLLSAVRKLPKTPWDRLG